MHPLFGTKYNGRMDGSGISFFRSPVFFFRQEPQIIICTVHIFPASEFFISALIITCVWYKCIIFRTGLFAFYQICRKIRAGGSKGRIITGIIAGIRGGNRERSRRKQGNNF